MTQENALRIFKSLSDMSRLRIVQSLSKGEMYTELLAERLGITPSTVSFHMKKLEEAGIVTSRKEQYYTVYSLNSDVLCRPHEERRILRIRQLRKAACRSSCGHKRADGRKPDHCIPQIQETFAA